jgi:hypothetical protein
MLRPGRRLLNVPDLTERQVRELKKSFRETTQWLTSGEQHALDVINGHAMHLLGGGPSVEVLAIASLDELVEAVESLHPQKRRRKLPSGAAWTK